MKLLITAGGQGTKLWPMSREDKPKQFQNIIGNDSLFQYQVNTLLQAYSAEDIFVSTKRKYVKFIEQQSPQIKKKNIIIEPDYKKNRGPGEGYAFMKLLEQHSNEPVMIIQSDCLRKPEDKFLEMIATTQKLVVKTRKFITGGQKAMYPDMGSDYLDLGNKIKSEHNMEVYKINKFIDRLNDFKKTKNLIKNYRVSTHCNHMCWYPELILEAYQKFRPDWYESLVQIRETFGKTNEDKLTDKIYSQMAEGMTEEVTKHVMPDGYVIMLPYKWTDIGTWGSIYEYFNEDEPEENYTDGNVISVESSGNVVKGEKSKLITVLGLKDVVIIDTKDTLFVTSKEKSGEVKKILEKLKEEGLDSYL